MPLVLAVESSSEVPLNSYIYDRFTIMSLCRPQSERNTRNSHDQNRESTIVWKHGLKPDCMPRHSRDIVVLRTYKEIY